MIWRQLGLVTLTQSTNPGNFVRNRLIMNECLRRWLKMPMRTYQLVGILSMGMILRVSAVVGSYDHASGDIMRPFPGTRRSPTNRRDRNFENSNGRKISSRAPSLSNGGRFVGDRQRPSSSEPSRWNAHQIAAGTSTTRTHDRTDGPYCWRSVSGATSHSSDTRRGTPFPTKTRAVEQLSGEQLSGARLMSDNLPAKADRQVGPRGLLDRRCAMSLDACVDKSVVSRQPSASGRQFFYYASQ